MGVRILDTEDKYIINVDQKLPLNLEQNNVPAAYRKAIRVRYILAGRAFRPS